MAVTYVSLEQNDRSDKMKGLNHLKLLVNQRIGNGQCYALSAEYAGILNGPGMGAGTQYEITHQIGNVFSASEIGDAYDWGLYRWQVIKNPRFEQLTVGAIINWKAGARITSLWNANEHYGHTGVIRGLEGGKIQTYEQNAENGEIVMMYERDFYDQFEIASIVIPTMEVGE